MDNLKCVLEIQQPSPKRIFVGVSGGLDSIVLLHMLFMLDSHPPGNDIKVLHINHHLQAQADEWEGFVRKLAAQYQFPIEVFHLDPHSFIGENIEAKAREGRYAFFKEHMTEPTDYLLLAQHQQDQVETFFFNLQRGAGLAGLCAMPMLRSFGAGHLLRPLLHTSRKELEAYAKIHQLLWVEDPSNQNTMLNRNFLRHEIMPKLEKRFSHFQKHTAQAIQRLQETRSVLESYLQEDVEKLDNPLDLKKWLVIPKVRQPLLLQLWVKTYSGKILSDKQLEIVIKEVIGASPDCSPLFAIPGLKIMREKDQLILA